MKKNKYLLLVLSILICVTAWFIISSSDTTFRKELREFAVKDTADISKIFLADRNGNSVTLERKNKNVWLLNGKDEPKYDFLKLFLDGIYKIDVRNRVAKAAYNNVIKALASSGIKCEIYLNGEMQPFKTYYVGGQTEDGLGTFMMIENSAVPFVTEIPGFNGYLTPRYSVSADAWKQTYLFHVLQQEMKSLSINYSNYPDKSFIITSDKGRYTVESPLTKKFLDRVDSLAVENYLAFYSFVYFEARAKELNAVQRDSILLNAPSIVVTLTEKNGQTKEVDIYPMPISDYSLENQDSTGKPLKYDVDRMYGYIKPDKEFVIIQHYTFDKLLRQLSDFDMHRSK